MRIILLGSGTSHGIPVVGCDCPVCLSGNPMNKRTRSSILVSDDQTDILVDTATEFRLQAVRENIRKIDGILYTHSHADHLHGLDDIRPLTRNHPITLYALPSDISEIENRFPYIFTPTLQKGGGKPNLKTQSINGKSFKIGSIEIQPVPLKHGLLDILGYVFNKKIAYITDCSCIPDESMNLLQGLEVLIIGALRYRPHPTHFSIDQALDIIKKISPGRAYLTHLCHDVDHDILRRQLPEEVSPANDGLKITIDPSV